ncbi:hypothetical protein ELG97_36830 (plasmid) [Rhizobium leguminosarum]|uniref:hypothetical protein n=1 Tax=Rhizobium leguminosarum TaxID=384 RepID=UPI001031C876|nr:hypothetical protein [Rhizobium leguminosarum]MBY5806434.1 hypothetical protein [Rhizobium leguminosarum]TBE73983.1 hypothetical protein ELG97_36830 [Rhizobium leguminosarum]
MNEINVLQHMLSASKRVTTAVVLTHNIDFMFAQAILVNRLRKNGAPRLTVFADAGCAAASFTRQSEIANLVGRSFRVVPVDLGVGRRFHPKAIFLAGPESARLAVGSGNLGHGGWSGNREIWTYFDYPGAGGPAIAAFRNYLENVCELAAVSEAVRATVLEPFQSEAWAGDLPEPDGLLALPADVFIMDQLLAKFDGPPSSFDLLSPYFDSEGEAAAELARRLNVPTRILIQQGKEGLSSSSADKLPACAQILGIAPVNGQRQTIHAKLYAARYPDRVILVAGSANCSRAALLSRHNGNAELMAVSQLTVSEYDELLAAIQISDEPPHLPEVAPNENWDAVESPIVRVLSTSFEDGVIVVRCIFAGVVIPSQIRVVLNAVTVVALAGEGGAYSAAVSDPGSRLWVEIDTVQGPVRSAPLWIDHEAELRIGRPEQNVQAKLAGNEGPISSDGLIDIFTLVVEHYNNPVPWSGMASRKKAGPAVEYNLDDVFSDGFGQRSYAPMLGGGYAQTDEWTLMNDYFRVVGSIRHPKDPIDPPDDPNGDPPAPKPLPARSKPLEPNQVQKLQRLIDKAVKSMSSMAFLESRPPARLAADIRTAALLLAIARRREGMDKGKVDTASAKLFYALFSGTGESHPLLDVYVERHPDAPDQMQSSELTAAMTLWIADLLQTPEVGQWFEFAGSRVAAQHPWLAQGKEDVLQSLERLSVHVASLAEALPEFWVGWIRGGVAVKALMDSLTNPTAFLEAIARSRVYSGEIVWVAGQFAVAQADFDRSANGQFLLLRDGRLAKFKGEKTVPIVDVVGKMDLPETIIDTMKRMLAPTGIQQVR